MSRGDAWIIEDVSITKHDEDRFDHTSVAREIADIARGSRDSLAIGLLGRYGVGKSSAVRLLSAELAPNKDWAVLQVSAERHTGVARGRGLLYGLMDEAHRQGNKVLTAADHKSLRASLEGSQQQTATIGAKGESPPPPTTKLAKAAAVGLGWTVAFVLALWIIGVVATWAAHVFHAWPQVKTWAWFTTSGAAGPTTLLATGAVIAAVIVAAKEAAQRALRSYDITLNTPRADTSDELEQTFLKLVRHIKRRVVVAIDDIDRLAAADVLEALSTVRSLLLVGAHLEKPPVFLISCDEDIIREAIIGVRPGLAHRPVDEAAGAGQPGKDDTTTDMDAAATDDAITQAADEYLNKLFTVRIMLPVHHGFDMRDYADQLLKTHPIRAAVSGPGTLDTVLDVLIHDGVGDPRHVIRLLNSFLAHYRLAQRRESTPNGSTARIAPGEVTGYPVELARLTVLQHDYRQLFEAVQREHELLHLLDDAILADQSLTAPDPLISRYLQATEPSTPPRLDYPKHRGLTYLRAVAPTLRSHRAPQLGPLLGLGSDPDSRQLGSATARAIRAELQTRNIQGFAARLDVPEGRSRVLQAAELAFATQARGGLNRDNALLTATAALRLKQHDLDGHEARKLADAIVRRRPAMSTPPDSDNLATLLAHSSEGHHSALIYELQQPPADEGLRRAWAVTLLDLVTGPHSSAFAAPLDTYFNDTAARGTVDDVAAWTDIWHADPDRAQASWPDSAYAFLLSCAARLDIETDEMITAVAPIVQIGVELRGWTRPVALGLLNCLNASDSRPLQRVAVQILHSSEIPEDEWGIVEDPSPELPADSTVALHLALVVAAQLREDEDDEAAVRAAALLRSWLAHWTATGDRTGVDLTTGALADTARTSETLARAAAEPLALLTEIDAARYATALASALDERDSLYPGIDEPLRDTLIVFLRRTEDSITPQTKNASSTIIDTLTKGLETDSNVGTSNRADLPHVLSTKQGKAFASTLAERIVNAISVPAATRTTEILQSLHLLFDDPEIRAPYLPQALSKLQQWFNYNQQVAALAFAAHYADEPAFNDQWLAWTAQHWHTLSAQDHDHALRAAGRPELAPGHGGAQLISLLVERLLTADADSTAWMHAPRLWPALDDDQRATLLAGEDNRCPAMAECAADAPQAALLSALQRADSHLERVFELLNAAPHAPAAIEQFTDGLLRAPAWNADAARLAVRGTADATPLWATVLAAAADGHDLLLRAAETMEALALAHPATAPAALADEIAPMVHASTDPATAEALGRAVAPLPTVAKAIGRTLPSSRSASEQDRARYTAFRRAAGLTTR
nr:hypothetical protein KitaXyl93_77180 [Kitasatospora sp. Xyl93]